MKYICKLCNGRGKQKNSLTCTCCRGLGFFNVTSKIEECNSCKGTGRAFIRTLSCIHCGGKGFSEAIEIKIAEKKTKEPQPPKEIVEKIPAKKELPAPASIEEPKTPQKKREVAKFEPQKEFKTDKIEVSSKRKKAVIKEEFGEEHLDILQESLTKILEEF